jgi:hypothetical protein
MTDQELIDLRRKKWRVDGNAVRTLDDARSFIESVGFCLMLPLETPLLVPTFVGAWSGTDENLPRLRQAFSNPRAKEATELMVRLLRDKSAYEANLFDENNAFLFSAAAFPYFYALVGERNPRQAPRPGPRSPYSELACDTYQIIHRKGPISKLKLLDDVGKGISVPALDRALAEFWDVLQRWAPDAVSEGINTSANSALSALLSKYLDCVVAAELPELESLFGNFVPRSKVRESVNALLAARELSFVSVGHRSLIQITETPVRRTEAKPPNA